MSLVPLPVAEHNEPVMNNPRYEAIQKHGIDEES